MNAYKNLVFKGGGVCCLAYDGVLHVMGQHNLLTNIKRVAGASGGGITALPIALGYSADEIHSELQALDFKKFKDSSSVIILEAIHFSRKHGLCPGEQCLEWFEKLVEQKTGSKNTTFKQLKELSDQPGLSFKELYFAVTNVSTRFTEMLSFENTQCADWPIALAARASMAIPGFFDPVIVNGQLYVDGGCLNNYPIETFDDLKYMVAGQSGYQLNPETLGIRVDQLDMIDVYQGKVPPPIHPTSTAIEYAEGMMEVMLNDQDSKEFDSINQFRTVYCDNLNISPIDFAITTAMRAGLYQSGFDAFTKAYPNLMMNQSQLKTTAITNLKNNTGSYHIPQKTILPLYQRNRDNAGYALTTSDTVSDARKAPQPS